MTCSNDDIAGSPRSLVYIEKNYFGEITSIVQIPKEDLNIFSRVAQFAKRLIKSFSDFLSKAALLFKRLLSCV